MYTVLRISATGSSDSSHALANLHMQLAGSREVIMVSRRIEEQQFSVVVSEKALWEEHVGELVLALRRISNILATNNTVELLTVQADVAVEPEDQPHSVVRQLLFAPVLLKALVEYNCSCVVSIYGRDNREPTSRVG